MKLQTKAHIISILLPLFSAAFVVLTHYVIRSDEAKSDALTFILQVVPYCFLDMYETVHSSVRTNNHCVSLISHLDWRTCVVLIGTCRARYWANRLQSLPRIFKRSLSLKFIFTLEVAKKGWKDEIFSKVFLSLSLSARHFVTLVPLRWLPIIVHYGFN